MPDNQPPELYRKYRPKRLKDVVGQEDVIRSLANHGKSGTFPHAVLLSGHTGVGKTTLARIFASMLKCGDRDLREINCADHRGIDMAREIEQTVRLAPMDGKARVWILDEAHAQTSECQSCMLKVLEDVPSHAYFFLCTTDPQKLKPTVKGRCHKADLKPLTHDQLDKLLKRVIEAESMTVGDEVCGSIVEASEGSARNALVLLNMLVGISDTEKQLDTLTRNIQSSAGIEIARELIKSKQNWGPIAKILKTLDADESPEKVRHTVMTYVNSILTSGNKHDKAAAILEEFSYRPFYDGKPLLTLACYNVMFGRK